MTDFETAAGIAGKIRNSLGLHNIVTAEDIIVAEKIIGGRKMNINEAIEHALIVSENECNECKNEHLQLSEWLKELKHVHDISDKVGQIMSHYTFFGQREVFIEECAEAIQATAKLHRMNSDNPDIWDHFIEECADVLIMAMQMRCYIGAAKFDKMMNAKLDRQLDRIKAEQDE